MSPTSKYAPFTTPSRAIGYFCNGKSGYSFRFNGQEQENEINGAGNLLEFRFRGIDPRLGRFFAIDPLTKAYPSLTPYQFASNTPIWAQELEGLEANYTNDGKTKSDEFGVGSNNTVSGPITKEHAKELGYTSYGLLQNIGTTLVEEIAKLPETTPELPAGTYSLKTTFENSTRQQRIGGLCYATTMARVNMAFQRDLGRTPFTINFDANGNRIIDGNTPVYELGASINLSKYDKSYYGFGVGSALSYLGYGIQFVSNNDVWSGKLMTGAIMHSWHKDELNQVIQRLSQNKQVFGHSFIFDSYIRDSGGNITGMNFWDYSGYHSYTRSKLESRDGKTIVGSNLLIEVLHKY